MDQGNPHIRIDPVPAGVGTAVDQCTCHMPRNLNRGIHRGGRAEKTPAMPHIRR